MPLPKTIKRRELMKRLARLGAQQLPKGRSRETFVKGPGTQKVRVPNAHRGREISRYELKEILDKLGFTEEDWDGAS